MNFRPIFVLNRRTFRQNKGRNLVAVLAIVLTTLMFTTLFVLSQSMSRNIIEMTFRQTGYDGQASFKSMTDRTGYRGAGSEDRGSSRRSRDRLQYGCRDWTGKRAFGAAGGDTFCG